MRFTEVWRPLRRQWRLYGLIWLLLVVATALLSSIPLLSRQLADRSLQRALQDEPVAVMGMGGQAVNHLTEEYDGRKPDIFDHGFAVVEFTSGAKAQLDLSMFAEGSENEEEISLVGDTAKLEVKIPEGVITFMPRRPKNPTHETVEVDEKVLEAGSHFGSSYFQHLDFQKAIREGTPALVTARDGRMSVQMGLAAQISMTERRWVEMSELA